jgi:hypothetical protein
MPTRHDPLQFITGFGAKLATRSRHVCAFLGAGAGRACGLPDVSQLQASILERLDGDDKAALASQLEGRNLEQALSRLRRIAALLTGNQTVDGLTTAQACALDNVICHHIVRALDISGADLTPVYNLAAWAGRADYHLPVELFTVNYDLLLETALERLGVPYFDGFVGNLKARFRTELVEAAPTDVGSWVPAFFVRLWKLHGSVNWAWEDDQQIVRLGQPITKDRAAAIYPSDTKYEESRRVPFIVLQDRLRRAMHQPETLVVISGYSFSDADLNESIFDAATRRPRSEFVTFCYSQIPDVLADRASRTPNLQVISGPEAILGGIRGEWKPPDNPPPNLWDQGQLAFRDFATLATYLARSVTRDPEGDAILRELLTQASPKPDANAAATGNA